MSRFMHLEPRHHRSSRSFPGTRSLWSHGRRLRVEALEDRRLLSVLGDLASQDLESAGLCGAGQRGIEGSAGEFDSSTEDLTGSSEQLVQGVSVTDGDTGNHAPVLTPGGPSTTTDPHTALTRVISDFVNHGPGSTTIVDADAGNSIGGVAVIGASGQGTLIYSLDGATFQLVVEPPTPTAALLLPGTAMLRYTPDGVNAEVATITFRAWDRTTGQAGETAADTTLNGGSSAYSAATDTLAVRVVRQGEANTNVGLYNAVGGSLYLRNAQQGGAADETLQYSPDALGWQAVLGDWDGNGTETPGLYDASTGTFYLRNSNSTGNADRIFDYGPAGLGWQPVVGDWNHDGFDTIGLYNPVTGTFYLRNSNSGGNADFMFDYGPAGLGWQPLVGDWNHDGFESVGLYDAETSTFYLRDSHGAGAADWTIAFGPAAVGWQPLVGDWDADGWDTVGLYAPGTSTFYLRNYHSGGAADLTFDYGPAGLGWRPLAGDWNADRTTTVGLYDPSGGSFFLRNVHSGGNADLMFSYGLNRLSWQPLSGDWFGTGIDLAGVYDPRTGTFAMGQYATGGNASQTFRYGVAGQGWQPIVGDWDGDGDETAGLYDPASGMFFLRNSNSGGDADLAFQFGPGGLGWKPLVGDWNGDGVDTVGLYEPSSGTFFLHNSHGGGAAETVFSYGPGGLGWTAMAGDWNGDGVDTIGLYVPLASTFHLRNSNSLGVADVTFDYGPGGAGWTPLAGDWNGNAFMYTGSYPEPQDVTYTQPSGTTAQMQGYPGLVEIFLSREKPVTTVATLVEASGGIIIAQSPSLGYYMAGVVPGREAAFTAMVGTDPAVILAAPTGRLEPKDRRSAGEFWTLDGHLIYFPPKLNAQVAPNLRVYFVDLYPGHGDQVAYAGWQKYQVGGQINVSGNDYARQADVVILRDLQEKGPDSAGVINRSLGCPEGARYRDADVMACQQGYFLSEAGILSQYPADVLQRTVVVMAAGNGRGTPGPTGYDLVDQIELVHDKAPRVFPADDAPHMFIVGGVSGGAQDHHYNYSSQVQDRHGNPLVVYAESDKIQVGPGASDVDSGTSYATAIVSRRIANALAAFPGLPPAVVLKAFAKMCVRNNCIVPKDDVLIAKMVEALDLPTIKIDPAVATFDEGDQGNTTENLTVRLSHAMDQDVTFTYEESNGDALDGRDYAKLGPRSATIPKNATSVEIPVCIIGDETSEPDRSFFVNIKPESIAPVGHINLASSELRGEVEIVDDDLPALHISDPSPVVEGNSGSKAVELRVTLTPAVDRPVTFRFNTWKDTAIDGEDFVGVDLSELQTIPAGATETLIRVYVVGDTKFEPPPPETFHVFLIELDGATLADPDYGIATVTIQDDDQPAHAGPWQVVVTVVGDGKVNDNRFRIDTAGGDYVGDYYPGEAPFFVHGTANRQGERVFWYDTFTGASLADSAGNHWFNSDSEVSPGVNITAVFKASGSAPSPENAAAAVLSLDQAVLPTFPAEVTSVSIGPGLIDVPPRPSGEGDAPPQTHWPVNMTILEVEAAYAAPAAALPRKRTGGTTSLATLDAVWAAWDELDGQSLPLADMA